MDILQAVLVFGAVLSPLAAALAIATTGLLPFPRTRREPGALLAVLGALASACCALGLLITRVVTSGGAALLTESPLTLGSWSVNGRGDLLRIGFGLRFGAVTPLLASVLALTTATLFTGRRDHASDSPASRWLPLGGSLLLFASIGVTASTNFAELFVFCGIGTAVVYVLSSLSAENPQQAIAARKLVLVLSVSDALLACAVFILAGVFGTFDFLSLFGQPEVWARAAERSAGLVDLVGLCVLGAAIGRCGMIPFLGWVGDLAARPARLAALIEAISLLPCGAVLLVRSFPLLISAGAIVPLAAFVGGSSAFCLAVCAVANTEFRRAACFACASVLGTVLLGLSTPSAAAPIVALGLLAVYVPATTAILTAESAPSPTFRRRWLIAAIVILFSGIFGQAWLLGSALETLFSTKGHDAPPLLLAVLLAACAQYMAAASLARTLGWIDAARDHSAPSRFEPFAATPVAEASAQSATGVNRIVLAVTAATAGVVAAILNQRAAPEMFASGPLGYAALGLIPGVGGLVAGAQSARAEWRIFPADSVNGVLMRLGRGTFYFDAFLFLFVLVPLRGVAGLARFVDWAVIDTLASGGPASLFESAGAFFGPVQRRGVFFYLVSAVIGTVVLSALLIWLRA
jgi:NADH:ubiquinone oxidoreductase subunit 5 (subunit L)/multisubunit Na+/H+ antiporter MnhA subunit